MVHASVTSFFNQLHVGVDVDFAKTNPGRIAYNKAMIQGINIPKMFRAKNFDHWRIRIQEYDLESPNPDNESLRLIDEILVIALACSFADIAAIVAFQAEQFKLNPVPEEIQKVVAWWQRVARKFESIGKNKIAFNLVIETTGVIPDDMLNTLYDQTYKAIQEIDPGRICIVAPNKISRPESLPQLIVPGEFCFVESHLYASGINPTDKNKLWTTGTDAEKAPILKKLDLMKAYADRTGIPVWIGAILSGDYNKDDNLDQSSLICSYTPLQQAEFIRWFMGETNMRCIPVAWNSDTKIFDRELFEWIDYQFPLVQAMTGYVAKI